MAYTKPQVEVVQDFSVSPVAAANRMPAFLMGGHAQLVRFANTSERARGYLGYYDPLVDTVYAWPNRPIGSVIDTTYTKVWIRNALLKYFTDFIGSNSTITKTAGYTNRIRSATVSFAANTSAYPRSTAVLYDRDVKVGDVVKVRGGTTPTTVWTYVKSLIGDAVAGTRGSAVAGSGNQGTQSAATSVTKTAGAPTCITAAASAASYSGLASGYVNETYTLVVMEGSTGSNLTTARLRIISASGTDNQEGVAPAATGVAFAIGTRGATFTFTVPSISGGDACAIAAAANGTPPGELVAGQRWQVVVTGPFTATVGTSAGTYTGTATTNIIVKVIKGGLYAAAPLISVTTADGSDVSGPTEITAAATAFAVGTRGVTISFGGTGLRKGDEWTIPVTGVGIGAMKTIELAHAMPSAIADGDEVDVTLFILKPELEMTANRTGLAPAINWSQADGGVTVQDGVTFYDSTWTNSGVPMALPLESYSTGDYGALYVEYRAWLQTLAAGASGGPVLSLSNPADLEAAVSGSLSPDNPLKWALSLALGVAAGNPVKYVAVGNPASLDSWSYALNSVINRDDVYELVALTADRAVQNLVVAHVQAMSGPTVGMRRVCWVPLVAVPTIPVVHNGSSVVGHVTGTTSDGAVAQATFINDADTTGTYYKILNLTSANAGFMALGVRVGDIVRAQFSTDGFGTVTYKSFPVTAVVAENQLKVLTDATSVVNVAAKIEVWRNLLAAEEAIEIGRQAGAFGDRRVRAVWPDTVEVGASQEAGYFVCAYLAALAAGVYPHQGLTHIALSRYTAVPRTTQKFTEGDLDVMADAGVWIVTQDMMTGAVYSRQAITAVSTDDLNQTEEMITRNVDSITFRIIDALKPYIGVTNVTPTTLTDISATVGSILGVLAGELSTQKLGAQLISSEVIKVVQSTLFKDTVDIEIDLTVPYALNRIRVRLVV